MRDREESLQQLAQELEHLVRRAYPDAPEMVTSFLLKDQLVYGLGNSKLQVYVKQTHLAGLQEALARALKLESFMASCIEQWTGSKSF